MINRQLTDPKSIVVVGGSNDLSKPGGRLLNNLIIHGFAGDMFVVNRNSKKVQGIDAFSSEADLPEGIDLAILSIPAKYCVRSVKILSEQKNVKAFIILSAGFGEAGDIGQDIENEIVEVIKKNSGCLIGPNCIGVLNVNYSGVFTLPIPELTRGGCDLISGSGATAVFLMEAGIPLGVKFSSVFSVGNSAMIGVEEVLEYMDQNFDPQKNSKTKLLYLENISNPKKFLKHARSLVRKGARIAAIKAGSTDAGSRAAASHTGALSSSDMAVRALFRKAGIVYCSSRTELLSVASLFHYRESPGKNFAIITHAGGSAVMLTDAISKGGLNVPEIKGPDGEKLLQYLNPGSSVSNPIDFLATGTAEQLGIIIDYCENKFDEIDSMIVVFGSPGLFNVEAVYNVLSVKLDVCKKPIYPVLPSVVNAQKEIAQFLKKGNINFPDEVALGNAIVAVHNQTTDPLVEVDQPVFDSRHLKQLIENADDGFLSSDTCSSILKEIGITVADEFIIHTRTELEAFMDQIPFPCVMKVIGPIHKTDSGGVILNISDESELIEAFETLMRIENSKATMIQPMLGGHELFIGAKREHSYGHLVFCGFGGIYIELIQDYSSELAPVSRPLACKMVERLRSYPVLSGYRGKEGVDIEQFVGYIERISMLVMEFPEIAEIDINPIMATKDYLVAVDVRIKVERGMPCTG